MRSLVGTTAVIPEFHHRIPYSSGSIEEQMCGVRAQIPLTGFGEGMEAST